MQFTRYVQPSDTIVSVLGLHSSASVSVAAAAGSQAGFFLAAGSMKGQGSLIAMRRSRA